MTENTSVAIEQLADGKWQIDPRLEMVLRKSRIGEDKYPDVVIAIELSQTPDDDGVAIKKLGAEKPWLFAPYDGKITVYMAIVRCAAQLSDLPLAG
jgi:hypothetical protein